MDVLEAFVLSSDVEVTVRMMDVGTCCSVYLIAKFVLSTCRSACSLRCLGGSTSDLPSGLGLMTVVVCTEGCCRAGLESDMLHSLSTDVWACLMVVPDLSPRCTGEDWELLRRWCESVYWTAV